jgi:predicted nucleic acid-binding protein
MYLLDTDILSASRRPEKASPQLAAWVVRTSPLQMHLSAVSVLEIRIGALRIARHDKAQGSLLQEWLESGVLAKFEGRILPLDSTIAFRCAELHVPNPAPERDAMIAATALVHNFTLVTRNIRHFASMGVRLFNPWIDEPA